jgi:hypothetical protein
VNWNQALDLVRNVARAKRGAAGSLEGGPRSDVPRLSHAEAAALVLSGMQVAREAGYDWDWFRPGLAALDYRRAGDRFPVPASVADKLLDINATAYLWNALAGLAVGLDRIGEPVRQSTFPQNAASVALLERAAFEQLERERKAGHNPTWLAEGDTGAGRRRPTPGPRPGPELPPLPDKPPPIPDMPLPTVPRGPDGGTILLVLGLLWLATSK